MSRSTLRRIALARFLYGPLAVLCIGLMTQACTGESSRKAKSVELKPITLLSGAAEQGNLTLGSQIRKDSRGYFYAAPVHDPGRIAVYDVTGQFLTLMASHGQGPGEIQRVNVLAIGEGDTLHVFDWQQVRWSRFSPAGDFTFSSQVPGHVHQAVATGEGRMVLHMHLRDSSRMVHPFHIMTTDGEIERSFGTKMADFEERNLDLYLRNVSPAAGGGIWVAPINRYEVGLWNLKGEQERTLQRFVEWFRPWDEVYRAEPLESRPRPRIAGIQEDGEGHLWVLILVASEDWDSLAPESLGELSAVGSLSAIFDWVIEVLDSRDASLIAQARYDGPVQLVGNGIVAKVKEQPDGQIDFEVCVGTVVDLDKSKPSSQPEASAKMNRDRDWEAFPTEERIYWTKVRLETIRYAVRTYARRFDPEGRFPQDFISLTKTKPRLLKPMLHNLISGSAKVVIGPIPEEPASPTGDWYYDPETGEVRLGITGPDGPIPVTWWLTELNTEIDPWHDW